MSSKRAIRRRACSGKNRYDSAQATSAAIYHARQRGHFVRAYRCNFCGGLHIGHFSSKAGK